MKKVWTGSIAVFFWFFVAGYVFHQYLMAPLYQATASLWRPPEEMKMVVMLITQVSFSIFFTLIFSKGYTFKGMMEGVRYGFYVAMMVSLPAGYNMYATMPVPYTFALYWFLGGLVLMIGAGIILSYVFGKKGPEAKVA